MIKKIFTWVGGIINIILILALILYPWIVKGEGPITFYWECFKELWVVIREPGLLTKLISIFK